MAETLPPEAASVQAETGQGTSPFSEKYDPKRVDYIVRKEGNDVVIRDPLLVNQETKEYEVVGRLTGTKEGTYPGVSSQPEKIMAEGTLGPEIAPVGSQAGQVRVEGQKSPQTFTREQVLANAKLSEEERVQAAEKLLGRAFSKEEHAGLLRMHQVGAERPEAGVFNYSRGEIEERIRIGRETFTNREDWKALIKSGLAGKLSGAEFDAVNPGFNPDDYKDALVQGLVKRFQGWGKSGKVDEVVISRVRTQLSKMADNLEIDPDEADKFDKELEAYDKKTDDPWLPRVEMARLKEMTRQEGGSDFSWKKNVYEYYMSLPDRTDPAEQQALTDLRNGARKELADLLEAADQIGVLIDARKRAYEFYKKFKAAKRRDKWGRDKQDTVDYAAMQSYHELFWTSSATLKPFEGTLRGAAKYLFDGTVSESYKELQDDRTPNLNIIAKEEFQKIQEQRIRDRKKESKYDVNNYYGRRSYELAAENAAELPEAVLELVRDRLAEVHGTDMQTVDSALKEIRAELDQLLGTNRVHLEKDEGQKEVTEDNPDYKRAKNGFEAVTDAVGYEKIIGWEETPNWENGGEVAASYVERFAGEYIGHHDAIYLMRRVARILYKLRTHKEGTYWTGHPFSEEKVDLQVMRVYRQQLQKEIQDDAATHELFITDQDFDKRLERRLGKDGKPAKDLDGREIIERDLRYSFEDNIEKLLLDPGDIQRAAIVTTGDAEALKRYDIRVKVFRDIKARWDKQEGWAGLSDNERQKRVRDRILAKMKEESSGTVIAGETKRALEELKTAQGSAYDKILWDWVKEYNDNRSKGGLHIEGDADWYPSYWDLVRMKIDRPEKLVDRKLTDEQLDAMYEEVQLDNLTEDERALLLNEVRFQFIAARDYALLEMEDALYGGIRTRIRDENGRVIDLSHMTRRVFDIVKGRLKTAIAEEWDELEKLKSDMGAAIKQAEQANDFKKAKELQEELDKKMLGAQFLVTHALKAAGFVDGELPVWNGQLRSDTVINFLGDVLKAYGVNVAFGEGISHNSKELLYELLERGRRAWQSEWNIAAQKYMVGKYPVPELDYDTTHGSPTFGQLVPQYEGGKVKKAKAYRKNVWGEEVEIRERNRIVNPGSPNEHQGIVDPRFNSSTSGGIAVPEFTDELADYLFAVPMVKNGAPHINALHGYLKGLDEVQAQLIQKLFTSNDAVYNAKERIAAYGAKRAFMGGKNAEGRSGPGFGNEPFEGAFKAAGWLQKFFQAAEQHKLANTYNYVALMQQGYRSPSNKHNYSNFIDEAQGDFKGMRNGVTNTGIPFITGDLERLRQLSYSDLDGFTKTEVDELYVTLGGVFDKFQDYLVARKGCIDSRGGRALRSSAEENHKAFYAFRREMREAIMGEKDANGKWEKRPERGFVIKLGYSPEITSEIALRMLEGVLMDSKYLGLTREELPPRVRAGEEILAEALTDQETREGFQVQEKDENGNILRTFRTFVIPGEKEWGNIVEDRVRQALVKIRRRGLLEFMREEGYRIYARNDQGDLINKESNYKEILGQGLPPLVQDKEIRKNNRKVKNAFNPTGIS